MRVSLPAVTRCHSLCWVSRCGEILLASHGVRWDALPETGRLLCVWRKGKAVHSLFSHDVPPLNLLWERTKSIWIGPTHPPKWHVNGLHMPGLLSLFGVGSEGKSPEYQEKISVDMSLLCQLIRAFRKDITSNTLQAENCCQPRQI